MSSFTPLTGFPAPGLRASRRFITSRNKDGKGVFVVDDTGDHHRVLAGGRTPVDMNDDKDMKYARDNAEPGIHIPNGSVVRLVDFAPGIESPPHRAMFLLSLDSGESKVMLPGDVSVNRCCMHTWKNLDEERPSRMVFILLDVATYKVNGEVVKEDLGEMASDYVVRDKH
ncbi:hypothetical protein N656DRAFT_791805 [Canariomyces notabilis]|uniref:Uncharacterized protein n=1 Tax=Canariomyces notabilis TaxID=2074819 RepID=A0AAN6T911_9PEZI|nr:hypothetical protein N656DRAFT_791805 [Canariomyces arenarius]